MSDIKDTVVEGLETIKTEVATQMDTKASVEAVETVKAEVLETTTAALEAATVKHDERMDELEAKFEAMPAIESKKETKMDLWTKKEGTNDATLKMDILKAVNTNTDVAGGRVEALGIIHTLLTGNFARNYGTVMGVNSGSVKIPVLSGITFSTEATVNTSRTQGGSLANTTIVIDNIVGSAQFSKPSVEDINGLDGMVMNLMMQEAAKKEATDAVGVMKAGGYSEVTTGAAAALPTTANIVGKLADVKAALGSAYLPSARWYVGREMMSLIEKSNLGTGGDLNFDPVAGVTRLWGHEIVVIDYFPSGGTANDKSLFFGDMTRGLIFASRRDLTVDRFYETSPGFVTYFGDLRSKSAVWDTSALISLTTKV